MGERIQVVIECAPDLWWVLGDPGEIGRAVMNLCAECARRYARRRYPYHPDR